LRLPRWIGWLASDVRLALRSLSRSPGFAALSSGIFALGLGTAALAFSLIYAVLLEPLPWARTNELFEVRRVAADGHTSTRVPAAVLEAWRELRPGGALFAESDEARHDNVFYLADLSQPERVHGAFVGTEYFDLLGTPAARGRTFRQGDEGERVAVISHGLWVRAFGASPDVVGRVIRVNGDAHTVIGVMPAPFFALPPLVRTAVDESVEAWTPAPRVAPQDHDRVLARVPAGVSRARVEEELAGAALRVQTRAAERLPVVQLVPVREVLVGGARPGLLSLALVMSLVLLLACANVGAVLVARFARRGRELAIRASLGARGRRLFVHLLGEGLVPALAGGAIGLLLAVWAQDLLRVIAPAGLPRLEQARINAAVVAFTLSAAVFVGLAAAAWPAAIMAFKARRPLLREASARSASPAERRARETLVIAQIVIALVLLAGAGVLVRSVGQLAGVDRGVSRLDVLVMDLHRRREAGRPVEPAVFYQEVLSRVHALPGVTGATLTSSVPFRPRDYYGPEWRLRIVDSGYFDLLGIRLRAGRLFDSGDDADAARVALISETLARRRFADHDPVGALIDDYRVVGVVADVRHESLDATPEPALYVPVLQQSDDRLSLLVRAELPPAALLAPVRDVIHAVDADQPIGEVRTLREILDRSPAIAGRRFQLRILLGVAGFSVLLAALGTYGATLQTTEQRSTEIGMRMALGATRRDVALLVLQGALRTALIGVLLGGVLALAFTRSLSSVLFRVTPADPLALAAAALLLGVMTLAACALPARRAARLDPLTVLRGD
jgi:predicted permease